MTNNREPNRRANIGGIDSTRARMPTGQVCNISGIGVDYFNKNAVANVISWSKLITVGLHPDYVEEYDTFALHTTNTAR